ncbi:MAG: hypothetical protein FGM46_04010 [Ferruginibacter sp.]|nr:hypothetical protein [Ferruginibacter sp.]
MRSFLFKTLLIFIFIATFQSLKAQETDLLSLVDSNQQAQKVFVNNAFKSSRVINGHSIEFIGKGILDVRILHRFGTLNSGAVNLFGLDQASMRMGLDYGVNKDLTVGIGRSTELKEFDGFVKYRLIQQSTGSKKSSPVSVVWVSGMTLKTAPWEVPDRKNFFSSRVGYYHQVIVGRKFSENFSAQIAPTLVHLNLVKGINYTNDIFAVGFGARYKLSKRVAFVVDYHQLINPNAFKDDDEGGSDQFNTLKNALSIGFDIETGGHVFQLHFSNSTGMNEKAFISNTTSTWGKGQIRFGFNLSRVFTVNTDNSENEVYP